MPQLAMHSIREMMGCADLTHTARLFETFLGEFREVDQAVPRD
jgi:aspartyl aminopeptidase